MHALALALLGIVTHAFAPQAQEAAAPRPAPLATLADEAERVLALVEGKGTRAFLAATRALPAPSERSVLYDAKTREARTAAAHAALAPAEQARFQPTPFAPEFYYTTRYGSPLAYARALDLVEMLAGAPENALAPRRILDYGYGGIGHLRLLASLGHDVVGVDVDALLAAYYTADDQGSIAPAEAGGRPGTLALVHGSWPGDEATRKAVGGGFDLILSKNTLKKGYVRPDQEVNPAMLVQLGVTPPEFLAEVARALKPGGVFAIYNLCPAKKSDRYLPWAYGESPFTREEFAAAGFELLAFDVDDRTQAMELGWALRWGEVEDDLFAWYTLARRRS